MSLAATDTALYVYGVIAAADGEALPPGLEVDAVVSGDLAAITRTVGLDEFGEAELRTNLNDRDWLERNARAHEDVLLAVAAAVDVVPFRFGTICRTRDDVQALVAAEHSVLAAGLERIRGRLELGVKLWADPARLESAAAGEEPSTGRSYLEARRNEQRRAADLQALCADVAREVYDRLQGHAVESVLNRPQPRELTGRTDEMLLNAAFLVDAAETAVPEEAERLQQELRDRGFTVELTGPWPAHNFVEPPEPSE